MMMERTECSETSAYKIQTPGNYPEENIQQVYTFWISRSVVGIYDTAKDIDRTVHVRNVKYAVEGTTCISYSLRCHSQLHDRAYLDDKVGFLVCT
jgi:hypothetical protein